MSFLTWRRRMLILGVNIFVLAAFLGLGYLLDSRLGTRPFIFILGFILSFPASLALLIRVMKNDMEKEAQKAQANPKQ